jgi:anti-sigma factor RsiW
MLEHGIAPDTWLAFLDGTLEPEQSERLLEHARECPACAAQLAGFSEWQRMLTEEGEASRARLREADARVQHLTARILASVHNSPEAASPALVAEALATLRAVLEPICGSNAAETTMHAAAARSSAAGLSQVGARNWSEFVTSLGALVASYCGNTPARLVMAAAPRFEEAAIS